MTLAQKVGRTPSMKGSCQLPVRGEQNDHWQDHCSSYRCIGIPLAIKFSTRCQDDPKEGSGRRQELEEAHVRNPPPLILPHRKVFLAPRGPPGDLGTKPVCQGELPNIQSMACHQPKQRHRVERVEPILLYMANDAAKMVGVEVDTASNENNASDILKTLQHRQLGEHHVKQGCCSPEVPAEACKECDLPMVGNLVKGIHACQTEPQVQEECNDRFCLRRWLMRNEPDALQCPQADGGHSKSCMEAVPSKLGAPGLGPGRLKCGRRLHLG
mmetsp:Transcript_80614/g.159643  ORF Transcript_80614/g.159643 Transcript_80614/m.159643 type:complete len:270 (-) Transcript_80614:285-1094(-)